MAKANNAQEVMDEMVAQQNVDEVLRRDPSGLTKTDYALLVASLRAERVHFNTKEAKAKAKKEGIEEDSE